MNFFTSNYQYCIPFYLFIFFQAIPAFLLNYDPVSQYNQKTENSQHNSYRLIPCKIFILFGVIPEHIVNSEHVFWSSLTALHRRSLKHNTTYQLYLEPKMIKSKRLPLPL